MGRHWRCKRCSEWSRSAGPPLCFARNGRIKLLIWDQTGMVLVHKRLEGGVMRISSAEFAALFEGVDWRQVRPERVRRPLATGGWEAVLKGLFIRTRKDIL
jgi:transposase